MDTITELIRHAIEEDLPVGDITTDALFTDEKSLASFIAKEDGVISGIEVAKLTFEAVDPQVKFTEYAHDGDFIKKGTKIATVMGLTKSLLHGERIALNFLQRLSGIATLTHEFVTTIAGTKTIILDTRKTTPTLRILEKQAVKDGGGANHRMSLSDMAMIKDNHIKAAGSITKAVQIVKEKIPKDILIEVEVETLAQYQEALMTEADIIMLDNMSVALMEQCVKIPHLGKKLEASGNMTLNRVLSVAKTGVDFISVGALTHSYQSLDISLKFQ
ncbi:MAG: carboxylating nicotinate-nucleotide diphosphorylase [Candidatus Izemoplasmatales bacterium]|jgi:nicotinate-nucleotide pyrophosphorylase (carboxylating)|nr:carboxylating nicotinate-nucleotide diphosphorylase [Candidatus Izemoplasmatales bacterium]MDD3864921.1 carboxylating nicotinate-nucleotide diphosphorylase [Candidatus Izemoplasmatales bacterium]